MNNQMFGQEIMNQASANYLIKIGVKFPTLEKYVIEMTLVILEDSDMAMELLKRVFPELYCGDRQTDKHFSIKNMRVFKQDDNDATGRFWN